MTAEEKLKQAANNYACVSHEYYHGSNCEIEFASFKAGAEWALSNPELLKGHIQDFYEYVLTYHLLDTEKDFDELFTLYIEHLNHKK